MSKARLQIFTDAMRLPGGDTSRLTEFAASTPLSSKKALVGALVVVGSVGMPIIPKLYVRTHLRVKRRLALACRSRDGPTMSIVRDRRITLSFTDAVTVLMEACAIPTAGRSAFEARVRHLQRLGLPARAPGQKMSRIDYGITELAALATAFRLIAAFLIPVLAVRYVSEQWDRLGPFALAGAREALPADYLIRRRVESSTIAVIEGNALADLGQKGRLDERFVGLLGRIIIVDPTSADLPTLIGGAALVIDSRTYMPVIVERVAGITLATDADLMIELDRLRAGS